MAPTGGRLLWTLSVVLVLSSTLMSVFQKRVAIAMPAYPHTLTLMSPFVGCLFYGSYCAWVLRFRPLLLPPSARTFPKYKAVIVGILFSLTNILQNLGNRGNVVTGSVVILVGKLIVPVSLLLGRVFLGLRYTAWHLTGSALTIIGVLITILPNILEGFSATFVNVLYLAGSTIALAAALTYLEAQLKHNHPSLSVPYLWFCICVFELPLTLVLSPLNAGLQGLSFNEIGPNLSGGFQCLFGGYDPACPSDATNSTASSSAFTPSSSSSLRASLSAVQPLLLQEDLTDLTSTSSLATSLIAVASSCVDLCSSALAFYLSSLPCGTAFNISMGMLSRHGSATLVWLLRTLSLPLAAILFAMPWVMTEEHSEEFSLSILFGLVLVVAGLVIYIARGEPKPSIAGGLISATVTARGTDIIGDEEVLLPTANTTTSSDTSVLVLTLPQTGVINANDEGAIAEDERVFAAAGDEDDEGRLTVGEDHG